MTLHRTAIVVFVGIIAAGLFWVLGPSDSRRPVIFLTEAVERGDIRSTITATGRVDAIVSVDVGSQLSGQLAELLVDFNDQVEAGQPIARLDDRSFKARVTEARARLQSARADVSAAQAIKEGAKARLAEAELLYERSQTLHRSNQISATEMDRARAEWHTARSEVAKAEAEKLAREAAVSVAEAALYEAEVDLERSVIRSPIDGVVIERQVDKGQTVAASLEAPTLFTIAHDLREMKVDVRVDEADIGRVAVGQNARFTVDAYPARRFQGRVKEIRKAPDTVDNVVTYTVVVTTANPDLNLLPGMTALMEIVVAEREGVLRIPNAALRYRPPATAIPDNGTAAAGSGGDGRVWLPQGAGAIPLMVATGASDGAFTEATGDGLSPGQPVIVGHASGSAEESPFGLRIGF